MDLRLFEHITKENFDLSSVSSMRTGGKAKYAFFPESANELCALVDALRDETGVLVVGNSSNLLFPDDASQLTVVFTAKISEIKKLSDTEIFASCGAQMTSLSNFASKEALSGLEFAFGIPGSVGGGVFMNAGAYGGEMSQVIKSVLCYDAENKKTLELSREECNFSYRHSIFMENKTELQCGIPMQELLRMAASPAGQQLIAMIGQQGGSDFQKAMNNAAAGDYTQAKQAIEKMMSNPQAQKLLRELGR
jgi:UDP-N-acetylmuramate dehydrogenase